MKVEPIILQDTVELLGMCKLAHQECRYKNWPYSEEMVGKMLEAPFRMKCVNENEIAGFFLGTISTMEFSPQPVAMQILFWVKPRHRGSSAFYLLIKAFLEWCAEHKAPPFIAPHFNIENEKTYQMLEKLGLKEFGKIYSTENW